MGNLGLAIISSKLYFRSYKQTYISSVGRTSSSNSSVGIVIVSRFEIVSSVACCIRNFMCSVYISMYEQTYMTQLYEGMYILCISSSSATEKDFLPFFCLSSTTAYLCFCTLACTKERIIQCTYIGFDMAAQIRVVATAFLKSVSKCTIKCTTQHTLHKSLSSHFTSSSPSGGGVQ